MYPDSIIYEAENGLEFLKMLRVIHEIDLVLMDIRMPVMDGIEATRKALCMFPHLKILAISTYDEEEDIQEIIKSGASGFLLKGGDKVGIRGAMQAILQGKFDSNFN